MNIKQQKYKANRLSGMSAYKAAIAAGYKHNTAWNAHKNIEKRCNFDSLMYQEGLDDQTLLKVLADGIKVQNMSGQPTLVTKNFLELAFKLNGKLKEKVEHSGKVAGGATINISRDRLIIFRDLDDSDTTRSETLHADQGQGSSGGAEQV